jgi:hypothetical protein
MGAFNRPPVLGGNSGLGSAAATSSSAQPQTKTGGVAGMGEASFKQQPTPTAAPLGWDLSFWPPKPYQPLPPPEPLSPREDAAPIPAPTAQPNPEAPPAAGAPPAAAAPAAPAAPPPMPQVAAADVGGGWGDFAQQPQGPRGLGLARAQPPMQALRAIRQGGGLY